MRPKERRATGEQDLIRAPGQVTTIEDIGNIIVSSRQSVPIRIRDVAGVDRTGVV